MSQPMPSRYALEPARIAVETGDEAGVIVRVDGCVVAILIRLDSSFYAQDRGRWYVEAGFGRCAGTLPATFERLSEGLLWIAERRGDEAEVPPDFLAEADRTFGPEITNVMAFPSR